MSRKAAGGRPPIGGKALTAAERAAKVRAARAEAYPPDRFTEVRVAFEKAELTALRARAAEEGIDLDQFVRAGLMALEAVRDGRSRLSPRRWAEIKAEVKGS